MSIANGTVLGPYEIVEPLGAGGMGEVYRARDTRLERSVAIKVLRDGFASGTMRARFDREAKAISGLTHAHICALYDVGHQNGIDYLVMEYLEGETLADKIARGRLPLNQVLRYGAEIAQALHHAHRRGITHRDLKPGNVIITAGGVKLLDFGLAKLTETPSETAGEMDAVTRRDPLTTEGTIVGTLPYMSPEHVEGRTVDPRSDIFSLGVMLYEMATGHRPFTGGSQAALIASILSSDPPTDALLPPALDRVIRTALEKDPDERWQTAQDLARQLRWVSEPSAQIPAAPPRSRLRWPLTAALLLLAGAAGFVGWLVARSQSPTVASTPSMRLTIALPRELRLLDTVETCPFAISPDGKKIAIVAWSGDDVALFVRSLDAPRLQKIEGADGAIAPFWSSDSAWIGYSARGKLWKIPSAGGAPQAICDVNVRGAVASWQGDTILFAERPGARTSVFRVSAAGGEAVEVLRANRAEGEVRHTYPQLLDDGRHFLFLTMIAESGEKRLSLASLDSPVRARVATNVSAPRLIGERLIYVRDGKLLSQPFTLDGLLAGEPTVLAEDISFFLPTASAQFDVSKNGLLVYRTNTSEGRLVMVGRDGRETRVVEGQGSFTTIDVAPDGRKAAVTVKARATGVMDIWIYDLARGVRDRLTSAVNVETDPVWLPDGRSLVYSVGTGSPPVLVHHTLSESQARKIAAPGTFQLARSISPDGKSLYFMTYGPGRTNADIYRTALDGSHSEPVVKSEFEESFPTISPDGRWLAYVSNATGNNEVYLQDLAAGERIRISNRGGHAPCWRADSRELFYLPADRRSVMSAAPDSRGNWNDVTIAELFRRGERITALDALPDGKSFLVSESTPGAADDFIHVAVGW